MDGISVLASRSHLSEETSALISRLSVAEQLNVGSSLKLCWVAAGRADFYPRLAPTMQWDIAAGDAVVRAAGGAVVLASTGEDFVYRVPENARKDDLRNPFFWQPGAGTSCGMSRPLPDDLQNCAGGWPVPND